MDFRLTDEQLARRKEFFEVCSELERQRPEGFCFSSIESRYDTDEGWAYHLRCAKEFASRGWLTLGWPSEHGGQGTIMDRVLLAEARGYYDVPGVDFMGLELLAPTLLAMASEEIKREFLPGIASGDTMWTQMWSEPNAGSDLASLNTSAMRNGDEYILNGQKIWITGAHRAHWAFALVRTDPNAQRKQDGLTMMLFDMKTPGITVNPLLFMDGGHFYTEVFLDDVHVPVRQIVGEENKGWAVTQVTSGFERSNLEAIMAMQRQLDDLVEYCNGTKVKGEPLAKNPLIRNRLAEMASELYAARTLAYRIADTQIKKEMAPFDASAVKVFSGELQTRLACVAADILGPYYQVGGSKWARFNGHYEKWYHQCFRLNISMGTNEIQRNIIAWYGLGLTRMK